MRKKLLHLSFWLVAPLLVTSTSAPALAATNPLTISKSKTETTVTVAKNTPGISQATYAEIISFSGGEPQSVIKGFKKKLRYKTPNGIGIAILRSSAIDRRRSKPAYVITASGKSSKRAALSGSPRVSAGGIVIEDSSGRAIAGYNGPLLADSTFIYGLVNSSNRCGKVLMDPAFDPAYRAVIKELKRNSSRYVDAKYRSDFKSAYLALEASGPQFRLTGTVTLLGGNSSGSAALKLVEINSGAVFWQGNFSGIQSISDISTATATHVWDAICQVRLPRTITGTFQGHLAEGGVGSQIDWSGSVNFQIVDGYDQKSWAELLQGIVVPYNVVTLDSAWQQRGGSPCTLTGDATHQFTASEIGPFAALLVKPDPNIDAEQLFRVNLGLSYPTMTNLHFQCPSSAFDSTTIPTIQLITSDIGTYLPYQRDGILVGNYTSGDYSFQWALQVQDWFTPPN